MTSNGNNLKTSLFLVVAGVILYFSAYVVNEGEAVIVTRLGNIVYNSSSVMDKNHFNNYAGLHYKIPFLDVSHVLDVRLQSFTVDSARILTQEQKYVLVDYFVKWRISDLSLYYIRTDASKARAEFLLQQKINDALRAAFGKRNISDVIAGERNNVMMVLQEKADESARGLGIKVVDVRIKRIDLPKEVSESVFSRMSAERQQVAAKHRYDGKAAAETIKAEADATATVLLAKAQNEAAKIRAEGLHAAAQIYNDAYKVNPKFYKFYRSLQAYRNVFNSKNDILILRHDHPFLQNF